MVVWIGREKTVRSRWATSAGITTSGATRRHSPARKQRAVAARRIGDHARQQRNGRGHVQQVEYQAAEIYTIHWHVVDYRAVEMLQEQGFDKRAIGVIGHEEVLRRQLAGRQHAMAEDASAGAISGATVGGILDALAGLGTLAIPGIGTVLAVGTLAAALGGAAAGAVVGAVTGALIGALVGAGVPKEDVQFYAEGMRRGGVLVTLQIENERTLEALKTLRKARMVDVEQRRDEWRREGWDERAVGEPIESGAAVETSSDSTAGGEAPIKVEPAKEPPAPEKERREVVTQHDAELA